MYQFRIIKSSLLKRYTDEIFLDCINQTVGVDFYVHFLEVETGVRVKLQFWDTQARRGSVTRSYIHNSVGDLLVFDLTNRAFEHVQEWHAEVCEHVQPHTAFELLTGRVYQGLLSGEVELQEDWDRVKCLAPHVH
uniref:RAB42, member RAS oncogene family n=1 Tax=Salmo trutta TaxID=8032 RepID=A0A674E004_SALTR